uniref:Protease Do-like 10, mitochondrial n=1 Tax=Nicotiana sylvestris TaxID=4096 RepID=A0A1U7VDK1_NICSY|nr:PREDICTED: protease Do-like 10, mitochondrial [Nicotiana sylvestris]
MVTVNSRKEEAMEVRSRGSSEGSIFVLVVAGLHTLFSQLSDPLRENSGSGFVILGEKILTNAHVVADHMFVLVRKHGSPTKYRATVQVVGHECDLAILVVESEEFWESMNSELGDVSSPRSCGCCWLSSRGR